MTGQTVHVLPNAQRVCVRPARPADAPGIQDFVRRLSADTRRARFFAPIRELAPQELARLSSGGGSVFVAEIPDGSIVALADSAAGDDAGSCEVGVVVADAWQGQGLGRLLMDRLLHSARTAGIEREAYAASLSAGYVHTDGFSAQSAGTEDDGFRQWQLAGKARYRLADGLMLRANGRFNGQQIVAPATIAELRKGADPAQFGKAPGTAMRAGYSYHNQWWVPHDADGTLEAKGLMGQHLHINPAAELVVVKLSTHPVPNTAFTHPLDRQAFAALARAVRSL